ncbi:MAG: hypothetical protein LUD47_03845 [Clostridia bacterium]|nr:hypothetical protein [Clostridia bacterium]
MSQIEEILNYQDKEKELRAIEHEINSTPERKNFVQARSQLARVQEELKQLDNRAAQMLSSQARIVDEIKSVEEQLGEFDNLEELVESGADVSFYKKNAQKLAAQIRAMRTDEQKICAEVKKIMERMDALRKETIPLQKSFNGEISEAYRKMVAARQPDRDRIQSEMKEIRKGIDPELMRKYEVKLSEKVFPIVVPLTGGRCSGCGTELTISAKEKIKAKGFIECENCGKLLYSDGK